MSNAYVEVILDIWDKKRELECKVDRLNKVLKVLMENIEEPKPKQGGDGQKPEE